MMSAWARRMHRGAITISSVVTSCGHSTVPYPTRMEKVKFGVPLDQVCKHDIPGPLLILILKLNKEAPYKKDVFRAPGHQANMKKLIHFLQHGRLVNIENFSVYTIASVLKKFLRKLPGGIFGAENEDELFQIVNLENITQKRDRIHRLIRSLPLAAQHVLVLLFGTFHAIAQLADRAGTGMSSEALGVSVAPSFFQSCVSGGSGKMARMEDVQRFKVATCIMKFLIDNFGVSNLFGRENYEYYARLTGRILKVEEDWIFALRYPPDILSSPISNQEECQSTPALVHATEMPLEGPSPASFNDTYTRLSVSLEENGLYKVSKESEVSLDVGTKLTESTKSLSFLPQVHERQAARMKTRSEWFLNPSPCPSPIPSLHCPIREEDDEPESKVQKFGDQAACSGPPLGGSEGKLVRRTSSREKRLVRRSSSKSKKDKENGGGSSKKFSEDSKQHLLSSASYSHLTSPKKSSSTSVIAHRTASSHAISDQQHSNSDASMATPEVVTYHVTLTYKPRI